MNRSRKYVTCVLNPKYKISDNCKDCLCSTGIYTCKEITYTDLYVKSCGNPNCKLPEVRKSGYIHKALRGIYWGLRFLFDKYLQLQYPPRLIGRVSYYSQDTVNSAEHHDMGIYVEHAFDSRQFKKKFEKLGEKSNKISFKWDFLIKLSMIHKFFLFGRESCFENITIEVIK